MSRCPDCNKFVSNGELEVEVESGEEIAGEIVLRPVSEAEGAEKKPVLILHTEADIRLMLPCGECGTELKTSNLTLEMEEEHECDKLPAEEQDGLEIEGTVEVEPIDDYRTKDRKGRGIKNPRYQTHLYGAEATATATCPFCKEEILIQASDTVEASSMDDA